jgi:hypothetical protein
MVKKFIKFFAASYIDGLAITVALIGALCLILATVLAIFQQHPFAWVFLICGALFVLTAFFGAKLLQLLIERT